MNKIQIALFVFITFFIGTTGFVIAGSTIYGNKIYDPGKLKPIDSELKVKINEKAPDFTLSSISGKSIRLSSFYGKKMLC